MSTNAQGNHPFLFERPHDREGNRDGIQDRQLEGQRRQAQRGQAADLGATALQRTLAELEGRLATLSTVPQLPGGAGPEGVTLVTLGPRGQLDRAGTRLPYGPALPPADTPDSNVFAPAEALENFRPTPQRDGAAEFTIAVGIHTISV